MADNSMERQIAKSIRKFIKSNEGFAFVEVKVMGNMIVVNNLNWPLTAFQIANTATENKYILEDVTPSVVKFKKEVGK
jgi:hypothetical protein